MGEAHSSRAAIAIVAPVPPPVGGMALQAQALRDRVREEGFPAEVVSTNPSIPAALDRIPGLRAITKTLIYLASLGRVVPRVAVVHVLAASYFYFFARVLPAVLLCRVSGRRVIVNYRGGEAFVFFRRYGWLARPVLSLANVLTVPSSYLKRCFEEQGFAPEIIGNFVNPDRFHFRERTQLTPKLIVARSLEPMYNVEMAVRAFALIKQTCSQATLDVLGTGTEENRLKRIVRDLRLDGVEFYGEVPHQSVPVLLDRCDILLNPTNVDNFPMNLIEAFASGLAVVSTNVGGVVDLLAGSDAAALVQPDDYRAMAEKVLFLLNHPAHVQSQMLAGRSLAEKYSWESIRENLFNLYFPDPKHVPIGRTFSPGAK